MALPRCVMKNNDTLSELYVETYSDMSDDCETEILDGDIDIPIISPRKQSWSCPLVFTRESEACTVRRIKWWNR